MSFQVAIDGPAGAGKSTIAKKIAKEMGFSYVDTGALYRAIGLALLESGTDIENEITVAEKLPMLEVTIRYEDGVQHVFLNGEDVTGALRTQEVGEAASKTSAYPAVREKLLDLQRDIAAVNDVVMDGRDIGTCVLPNADVKIYLTASSEVRAKRRYDELSEKGETPDYETILHEIIERDDRDMHREIAPLKQAEDAAFVDTSELNIDEVTDVLRGIIEGKKN